MSNVFVIQLINSEIVISLRNFIKFLFLLEKYTNIRIVKETKVKNK